MWASWVIESDAGSSPDLIDLTGISSPVYVTSPTNAAPLATLMPSQSSLTFANTMVGNVSASQTVTLDNTGTATLNILGLQTTPDYTVSSNCASIVPGASCTLTVTFTPKSSTQQGSGSGQRAGAIEVSSNATTSLRVYLRGWRLQPVYAGPGRKLAQLRDRAGGRELEPQCADDQHWRECDHLRRSLRLDDPERGRRETDTVAVWYLSDARPGAGRGHKLHSAGRLCADAIGDTHGNALDCKLASTLPLVVALTGVGVQSHMQILPANLSFGSIAVNSPASLSLTLSNNGTAPITGVALAATGDYAVYRSLCGDHAGPWGKLRGHRHLHAVEDRRGQWNADRHQQRRDLARRRAATGTGSSMGRSRSAWAEERLHRPLSPAERPRATT